jgi:hypothetical protein
LLLPRTLQETIAPDGCRFWWLGNRHDSSRWRIYFRIDPRVPEIVWPGELRAEIRCGAGWRDVTDAGHCRCAHSTCPSALVNPCVIPFDREDPIKTAADQLANLMAKCESLAMRAATC